MTPAATGAGAGELVPLADRLRYMLAFRLIAAVGVALAVPLARGHLFAPAGAIAASAAAFLVLAFAWHGLSRLARAHAAELFGLTVIVDGVFLAWASYATGGAGSPVRYLIVLELLTVSLLASYRTGAKLALWQSLLVVAVYYAQRGGVLVRFGDAPATNLVGTPAEQTAAFVVVLWVVAIATACFSAVNERELRRRRADLEALAALTGGLERESQPDRVAEVLRRSVVDTFGFPRAWVVEAHEAGLASAADGSVLAVATCTRTTQLASELDPAVDGWLDAKLPGARNLIVVPLTAEGGCVGALVAEHESPSGSRIERRVVNAVERFAAHGALALRNARLLEEVRDLAANDPLTKLANRMTFGDSLDRELARARRDGGEVTLVMLDLDHFKRLNDTRGHQAGDEVLRRTAATLREQQRTYDTAARYGGEEFALIAPGLSAEHAPEIAERIRHAIASNGCGITASIGVATYPRDADGPDALVAAADAALYRSKHEGRDRVSQAARAELHR
jgi:two-component system cell cycle response regulator